MALFYNADKCMIVVLNEKRKPVDRRFYIGPNSISESNEYCYFGITCNTNLSNNNDISEACSHFRGTYFSTCICAGVDPRSVNPATSSKIYSTYVIPQALYGCELKISIIYRKAQ